MNPIDHQSESASLGIRHMLSLVLGFLIANQIYISLFFGISIAVVTLYSYFIQIKNAKADARLKLEHAERERVQAERDALAFKLREDRALERHLAALVHMRKQLGQDAGEDEGE